MAYWLFKEEPDKYNYADLEHDKSTYWDGVNNSLARLNLRRVRRGDRVLYYHTGKERAVIGEMLVLGNPLPDRNSEDPKAVMVKVKPVRRLHHPVSLERVKQEPLLLDWDLVRLSVLPVTEAQWQRIMELSEEA